MPQPSSYPNPLTQTSRYFLPLRWSLPLLLCRHQKICEEGPAVVAPPRILREMERCARRLAAAVGYSGAATLEYLYVPETEEFFFLELNPRLQV